MQHSATALYLVRDKKVIRLILAKDGVDVNTIGQKGTGALYYAVKEADILMVYILL